MWAAGLILLREGTLIPVRVLHGSCELEKLGLFTWSVQVEGQVNVVRRGELGAREHCQRLKSSLNLMAWAVLD